MKKSLILLVSILISHFAWAQDAYEGLSKFNKTDVNGVSIEMNYPSNLVEEVLEMKMKKLNLKGKNEDDYKHYNAIKFEELSDKNIDLYTKVIKKDKDKSKSFITFLISTGNQNFITSKSDEIAIANTKRFLNNLKNDIEKHILEGKIKEQKEVVEKDNKKLEDLVKEKASLESEIEKLKKKLEVNASEQEDQTNKVKLSSETLKKFEEELSNFK